MGVIQPQLGDQRELGNHNRRPRHHHGADEQAEEEILQGHAHFRERVGSQGGHKELKQRGDYRNLDRVREKQRELDFGHHAGIVMPVGVGRNVENRFGKDVGILLNGRNQHIKEGKRHNGEQHRKRYGNQDRFDNLLCVKGHVRFPPQS